MPEAQVMHNETIHKDERWKLVGFQGSNPVTDFRGMGLLSLQCLLYISKYYPTKVREMIDRTYPLCCSAINIASFVVSLLCAESKTLTVSVPVFGKQLFISF